MKTVYKTSSALKKECIEFAEKVFSLDYSSYSDDELREVFDETDCVSLAAAVKEVVFRKKNISLFASQIETAYLLYRGNITELPTGEGKTLAAVVAAVMFVKNKRRVHILVFNDYLAARDGSDNSDIFDFCGVTVGCVTEGTDFEARKAAYKCDVFYAPAREAGYDYIRNFTAYTTDRLIDIDFDVAIVDEADSILIDEASIPLVLAGKANETEVENLKKTIDAVSLLDSSDYEINEQERQVWLTDSGIKSIESTLLIDNLYDDSNIDILSSVNTALEAVFLLKRDIDYIVKGGKICVVDESTGRVAANRKFPGIVHKYVEMKENITDNVNTKIYCSMTIGAFMEQYKTLCGMTGTAATSASEFESTYQVRTVVINPHTPCIRNDREDEVFINGEERDKAVLDEILNANKKGQPVLIGTADISQSEKLSEKLDKIGVKHVVLNARNDEKEAQIIADAGKQYSVTVSTNMAGRGVDIKLGGVDESEKEKVAAAGGLYVISTTINRSRRIDNQLRGRAGRQGDIGESKFFISLDDENISPFFDGSENDKNKMSYKDKFAVVRDVQQTLEGNDAESRYTLKKYSFILEHQRQIISDYRLKVLKGQELPNILKHDDFDRYVELEKSVGEQGIEKAEQLLSLYYINYHFSNYLEAMEEVKSGIHLNIVAGKNPLDEFNRAAISSFDEMNDDIRFDILNGMREFEITKNGIDTSKFGLDGVTGTWTYMVDDNAGQFNHLPEIMNIVSRKIKSALSFSDKLDRFFNKKKKQ